jgi:homoserine kinase
MRFSATVPATVANLGPGFDCLSLAVELRNEVTVEAAPGLSVVVEGEGSGELPADGSNLVVRSMERLASDVGRRLPPVAVRCANRIPLERGLGSSAAATVAGLVLADRLLQAAVPTERLLQLAVEADGHADNVAACLLGGLTLAYRSKGAWQAERVDPWPGLGPVLLVPDGARVSTREARSLLPRDVPLEDAAFNAGRAALAVLALTARPDLLAEGLRDRLHQRVRLGLAPESLDLFDRLTAAGVPVCVAGAGPSLLTFPNERSTLPDPGPGWRVLEVRPATEGATVAAA